METTLMLSQIRAAWCDLETFLRGMETGRFLRFQLTETGSLKPSLEGWKHRGRLSPFPRGYILETFLRGMET